LVVPLTAEEKAAALDEDDKPAGDLMCSECKSDRPDTAPLYSIAAHIAFEEEVLKAIELSNSSAECDNRISRIIEEEGTPMVCKSCCPHSGQHRHDVNHAF